MARYEYYYALGEPAARLTCTRLAQMIVDRANEWGSKASTEAEIHSEDVGGALFDQEHWETIARLRWTLRSDGIIAADAAAARIAQLERSGVQIRPAMERIVNALAAKYPALDNRPALAQLAALGREMALATAVSDDLWAFVKNEMQLVNLAELFRI